GPDYMFDQQDPGEVQLVASIQQENQNELPLNAADIARQTRH
ncbi:unnamed protein product, partial [Rotaria magnacalcarata]